MSCLFPSNSRPPQTAVYIRAAEKGGARHTCVVR
jgi:hypothetical protein